MRNLGASRNATNQPNRVNSFHEPIQQLTREDKLTSQTLFQNVSNKHLMNHTLPTRITITYVHTAKLYEY